MRRLRARVFAHDLKRWASDFVAALDAGLATTLAE
jgi:hypothetical protein